MSIKLHKSKGLNMSLNHCLYKPWHQVKRKKWKNKWTHWVNLVSASTSTSNYFGEWFFCTSFSASVLLSLVRSILITKAWPFQIFILLERWVTWFMLQINVSTSLLVDKLIKRYHAESKEWWVLILFTLVCCLTKRFRIRKETRYTKIIVGQIRFLMHKATAEIV